MTILRRSAISIVANIVKGGLGFITGMLLARGLGPEQYGIFAFLLASFSALRLLLDMGTSNAFFTFISKRERTKNFFNYYILWLVVQFSLSVVFITILAPDDWLKAIWQGESRDRVFIAFFAVFLQQQIWNMIAQVGESQRLTYKVQVMNVAIAFIHIILVVGLLLSDTISIERVYYLIIIEFLVAIIVAYLIFPITYAPGQDKFKNVSYEYWIYCLPLIPYTIFGMMSNFADTWLLQYFGGAVEQAYFSVALQFANISMIATASVLRILWKEVAEANAKNDKEKLELIYEHTNRVLFMIGVIVSCFFIPWSTEVILLLLGDEYLDGALTLTLMFFVPPFLALSQVNSTMFYALELIKPFVIITTIQHIIMIITAYLFLATPDAFIPGLGLGSTGLALNYLLLGIINVNFSIWWLSQKQGWKYYFSYQLLGIGIFLPLGILVYYVINMLFFDSGYLLVRGIVAGILYVSISGVIIYRVPSIIGIEREKMDDYVEKLVRIRLNKYFGS